MLKSMNRVVVDLHVLWLLQLWLKVTVEDWDGQGKRRIRGVPTISSFSDCGHAAEELARTKAVMKELGLTPNGVRIMLKDAHRGHFDSLPVEPYRQSLQPGFVA
jgi:hypothetical protein